MRVWPVRAKPTVHTVTDARKPLSADIDRRKRRYLISMGVRTVCLLVAVLAPMPLPLRVVAIIAAVVLPYFAVVLANSGREPEHAPQFGLDTPAPRGDSQNRDKNRARIGHHRP